MNKITFTVFCIICILTLGCNKTVSVVDYVNPLQGSASVFEFSTGNTYPAVGLPWALNFWTPQTGNNGVGWQYVYSDSTITGFKQTHQPSPWINDYGCFSIMPTLDQNIYDQEKRSANFTHKNELSTPYLYKVKLDTKIAIQLTTTNSGMATKIDFPKGHRKFLTIDCFPAEGYINILPEEGRVVGYSKYYYTLKEAMMPDNFATYFILTFDKPIIAAGIWSNDKDVQTSDLQYTGECVGGWIEFDPACDEVTIKGASSFVDHNQATTNYLREVEPYSFEQIKTNAHHRWNSELERIKIKGGSLEEKRTFYTALYRTMLFPRKLNEYTQSGDTIHYSAFNGNIESGSMHADNGFWDTFRAVHPFFTIMYPSVSKDIMTSLLNIYMEGGWLPEWFSPSYKNSMIGQNSASVILDAYVKGICGYDTEQMFEALIKSANNDGPNSAGRDATQHYNTLGYIPGDLNIFGSVSKTLEYAYADYCIAKYAQLIGKDSSIINNYKRRSYNYKNVFDTNINFVRPRDSKGNWISDYKPDMWGGSFVEGSAWHWTWCVFHDINGLIELMGGKEQFIKKLDSVFIVPPTYDTTHYGKTIHEMVEMQACNMGQYAHGNQPIQHMIYLYNYAGVPYKTQYHVRDVMNKLYSSGWNDGTGLCGDEDNGQTSAWYLLSAMGFYPVCPGEPEYALGSPLFDEIELKLENGKSFKVVAHNNSSKNIYIQSASLNKVTLNDSYIIHQQIMDGGILELNMGDTPNYQWAKESKLFSITKLSTDDDFK